jgi:phosphoribosylanthranilate isomerase
LSKLDTFLDTLEPMRIKICGITNIEQGRKIASRGATDLGFICVPSSPRYLTPERLQPIITDLGTVVNTVGVFADISIAAICAIVNRTNLATVQLHGVESIAFCQELRQALPTVEIIKAWRVRRSEDLALIQTYGKVVDSLLLDAYHPDALGGTGQTLDWEQLQSFQPPIPWLLAGGLNPDNIRTALSQLNPDGIDLSSGVEISPGNKNLASIDRLFLELSQGCGVWGVG